MVSRKGFDDIIYGLGYSSYAFSQAVVCALIVRWMDTTYMFHLSFAEITIIPLDSNAITRLSFSTIPIAHSLEIHAWTIHHRQVSFYLFLFWFCHLLSYSFYCCFALAIFLV